METSAIDPELSRMNMMLGGTLAPVVKGSFGTSKLAAAGHASIVAKKAAAAAHHGCRSDALGRLRLGVQEVVLMCQVPGSGMRLMMLACMMTSARPSLRVRAVTRYMGLKQSSVGGSGSQL